MLTVLLVILEQFPFVIAEFHSDNGSEFMNHKVLAILERLHIALSKSRLGKPQYSTPETSPVPHAG